MMLFKGLTAESKTHHTEACDVLYLNASYGISNSTVRSKNLADHVTQLIFTLMFVILSNKEDDYQGDSYLEA